MELHKFISDILAGHLRVLSFDDLSSEHERDITAGVLSALNFARLAFAIEGNTRVPSKIIGQLSSRKTVESALAICRKWTAGPRLETEDVYRIPLFEESMKLTSTDYDSPSPDHVAKMLENLRSLNSSAAIVITRYPEVITCLRLQVSKQEIFVLFNPRVTSEQGEFPSITWSTSLPEITQRLCDIFPLDKIRATRANLDWQAKLLEKCAAHVFVPRVTSSDSRIGDESLVVPSLILLTLKAELEELARNNGNLKKEQKRLDKSVVDLEAQLAEEKIKTKRAQTPKPSEVRKTTPSLVHTQGSQSAQSPRITGKGKRRSDSEDEKDDNMFFAIQLQATFDSENDFLLNQKQTLLQTAQRQYHCGVCLDDFPEDDAVLIEACGHEICRDCARGHIVAKIEEHRFPVLCPVCMAERKKEKPGTVSGALVQLLGVSEKQWEIWIEMEMAQFSIPFNCRKCQHSGFVDRQDLESQSEIHCPFPGCNHVWCRKCQQTIEPDGPEHTCDGTAELDHLMKQQGWRYCPNCKTPIQKLQGCNHLSCIAPGCNTHFCYRCGNTINRTAVPREILDGKTAHYRTCSIW